MNSQEDFNALEYNNQAYNYIYYYDKISELISIPYIFLYYTDTDIIIKSYCTNNHESNLPLNEFLIKYHPLFKKYQNYEFCHKCWIKLFYGKKTSNSFFTSYCDICNKYFCSHYSKHSHKLKTVENEFLNVNKFIFPICYMCYKNNFNNQINGCKMNNIDLNFIKKNYLLYKNNLEEIEDFQKFVVRIVFLYVLIMNII